MGIKQFLTKYWYLTAGVVGVLSGVAVSLMFNQRINSLLFTFLPGIIFGLFSAGYFMFAFSSRPASWKLLLWILFSSVSFFMAYWGAVIVGLFLRSPVYGPYPMIPLVAGSLVGVSILTYAALRSFFQYSHRVLVQGMLMAGFFAPVLFVIVGSQADATILLFIFWQTMVMLALGYQIYFSARADQIHPTGSKGIV